MKVGIEEHIELLHLDTIEFRKEEMTALMQDDQKAQTADELKGLDKYDTVFHNSLR